MAIALAACSSSGSTKAPGGNNPPATNAGGAVVTDAAGGGGGGGDLSGAEAAFAKMTSYKFSMTLAGGTYGSLLSGFTGAAASGSGGFTVAGTVTVKPETASDVSIGTMRVVTVGGFDYIDFAGTGSFTKVASSGTSIADSFSPSSMFTSFGSMSDYSKVGSENKNGADTDHYQAKSSAFTGMGSSLGVVATATWTGDIWIAKNGGYPVSSAIFAKTSDGTVAFQMTFDISNINDSSLKVTAPTTVLPGI
jgi:hypothetical protein